MRPWRRNPHGRRNGSPKYASLASDRYLADRDEPALSVQQVRKLAGTNRFAAYPNNPVLSPGPEGSWDAGALGSMTVLKVKNIYHLYYVYYEAWGVRGNNSTDYNTLQIGQATSRDGVHWTKDPANPVLPKGTGDDWDRDGWDPFVLYEKGVFKMWYGGGIATGGRRFQSMVPIS
jgi:hypothetical protein